MERDISNLPCSRLAKLVYELRDLADEVIDDIFYEQETQVEKNLEEEQFIINRVIKSRGQGANKQVLAGITPVSLILGFRFRV